MPGIKAVGTNTAERTSAIPTTGPESSSIAFKAAFLGVRPSSMCRSTPSTTTMASSTTRPIASTRPKRESVHWEKHECADKRHGHREKRNQRGAPALQEKVDHKDHQYEGDQKRYDN